MKQKKINLHKLLSLDELKHTITLKQKDKKFVSLIKIIIEMAANASEQILNHLEFYPISN